MRKNKKRINTGKFEQWRRRDRRAIWVIPLSVSLTLSLSFSLQMTGAPLMEQAYEVSIEQIPPTAIPMICYLGSVLVLAIYFTISRNAKKTIKVYDWGTKQRVNTWDTLF